MRDCVCAKGERETHCWCRQCGRPRIKHGGWLWQGLGRGNLLGGRREILDEGGLLGCGVLESGTQHVDGDAISMMNRFV